MAYISSQPTREGIVFTIRGSRGEASVELDRSEVAETVTNMCRAAGLPEPWMKGVVLDRRDQRR